MNNKPLKLIFVICLITAIVFPLTSITYIYPSFSRLLISYIEDNAVRTGTHLAGMIRKYNDELSGKRISADFVRDITQMIEDKRLLKIKLFTMSGDTLYSTDAKEIGERHTDPAFYELVTHRKPYTKILSSGEHSLEGQVFDAHVAESYVPIVQDGDVSKVFELYYDITVIYNRLQNIMLVASLLPLGIMFVFLLVIVAVLIRTENKQDSRAYAGRSLRYRSPYLSMGILIVSLFFAEMVTMLIIHNTPHIPKHFSALLDAVILIMIFTPIAYFFLIQPLISYIKDHARIEVALSESQQSLVEKHETLINTFKQVQRSKIEWEKTMDSVGDMIILTNGDGKIKRINRRVCDFSGMRYDDIINKDWEELIHDCALEAVAQYAGSIELFHAATGKWFSLHIYPFEEQSICFAGNVITLHETTEMKHILEKLSARDERIAKTEHKPKFVCARCSSREVDEPCQLK